MISKERMIDLAPGASIGIVRDAAPVFDDMLSEYDAALPLRRCHLMGQLCHESQNFTRLSENLNYSTASRIAQVWPRLALRAAALVDNPEALANAAYAGKNGNGDEASGDGFRFRGRGFIQLTGRENYQRAGTALNLDLIGEPEQASMPATAAVIALWFWKSHGCNEAADQDDVAAVTRPINPALAGLIARRALVAKAKNIFV